MSSSISKTSLDHKWPMFNPSPLKVVVGWKVKQQLEKRMKPCHFPKGNSVFESTWNGSGCISVKASFVVSSSFLLTSPSTFCALSPAHGSRGNREGLSRRRSADESRTQRLSDCPKSRLPAFYFTNSTLTSQPVEVRNSAIHDLHKFTACHSC